MIRETEPVLDPTSSEQPLICKGAMTHDRKCGWSISGAKRSGSGIPMAVHGAFRPADARGDLGNAQAGFTSLPVGDGFGRRAGDVGGVGFAAVGRSTVLDAGVAAVSTIRCDCLVSRWRTIVMPDRRPVGFGGRGGCRRGRLLGGRNCRGVQVGPCGRAIGVGGFRGGVGVLGRGCASVRG